MKTVAEAHGQSEAVTLNLTSNQFIQPLDDVPFLSLDLQPEGFQVGTVSGVGDVLIIAPQSVESATQVVDQIAVMVEMHTRRSQMNGPVCNRGGHRT